MFFLSSLDHGPIPESPMVPETASLRVTELSTSLDKIVRVVSLPRSKWRNYFLI